MDIKYLNHESVLKILPDRDPWGHKGTFGKILLLCGSRGFTGAAYFAAMGALRSGAGLSFLGVPESIYEIEAMKLNEPVVFPLPDDDGMQDCDMDLWDVYADYINGTREISEINASMSGMYYTEDDLK